MDHSPIYILCIETATDVCSVALTDRGEVVLSQCLESGYNHSSGLLPLAQELLKEAEVPLSSISAIAVSDGPGSYTGLRVGSSMAKSLCYTLGIPMIAVSTLRALAQGSDAQSGAIIMPTIDARRMEVYTALYDQDLNEISAPTNLIYTDESLSLLADQHDSILICGNGAAKLAESDLALPSNLNISPSECDAADMAAIAYADFCAERFVDVAYHTPFYYKSPNVSSPKSVF